MKRRVFLGNVIASAAVTKVPGLFPSTPSRDEPTPGPSWLDTEPFIAISDYGTEMFMVRAGRNPTWERRPIEKNERGSRPQVQGSRCHAVVIPASRLWVRAEKETIDDARKLASC